MPMTRSVRSVPGDADVELERRARQRDAGKPRDARVERFGKAGAAAAHLEVGLAGERAHRRRDVAHRGAVDQVHAVAERDAERDAGDRERHAPAAAARREEEEQPHHRLRSISARRRSRRRRSAVVSRSTSGATAR